MSKIIVALVVFLAALLMVTHSQVQVELRGFINNKTVECKKSDPCRWGIYDPKSINHDIEYYFENYCYCPPNTKCMFDSDNLLEKNYIFTCRQNETTR